MKDPVTRFLNATTIKVRTFLLRLSVHVASPPLSLVSPRCSVWVLDTTLTERPRSIQVAGLSRIYDAAGKLFTRGFLLLTLGLSDGADFLPVSFVSCIPGRTNITCAPCGKIWTGEPKCHERHS